MNNVFLPDSSPQLQPPLESSKLTSMAGGKGQGYAATPSVQSKATFSVYGANVNSSVSQHGATESCKEACPGPGKTRSSSVCGQGAGGWVAVRRTGCSCCKENSSAKGILDL